jgi:hypothetical protein
MKAAPYKTKKGLKQLKPQVSRRQIEQIMFGDSVGWCLHCGEEVHGVEPDARRYVCEVCNLPKVYGMEELMMMGLVVIK